MGATRTQPGRLDMGRIGTLADLQDRLPTIIGNIDQMFQELYEDLAASEVSTPYAVLCGGTTSTGLHQSIASVGTAGQILTSNGPAALPSFQALAVTVAALTKVDDTNVTLTLGGSPATALLAATSLTLGWTGQLGPTRGGTGLSAVAVGDIIYGSAINTWSQLAKNTNASRYLSNAGVSNVPSWTQVNLANGVTATLADGSLSSNVMLKNGTNVVTGTIELTQGIAGALKLSGNFANTLVLTSPSTNSTSFLFENTAASGHSFSFFSSGGGPAAAGTFGIFDNTDAATRMTIAPTTGTLNALGPLTNSGMGAASAGTQVVITGVANEFRPLLSSSPFKTNIVNYDARRDVSTALRALTLKHFDYTDQQIVTRSVRPDTGEESITSRLSVGGKDNVGLLAEDVFAVLPEAVNLDDQGLPYSLRYDVLTTLLIRAYQQLADTLNVPRGGITHQ